MTDNAVPMAAVADAQHIADSVLRARGVMSTTSRLAASQDIVRRLVEAGWRPANVRAADVPTVRHANGTEHFATQPCTASTRSDMLPGLCSATGKTWHPPTPPRATERPATAQQLQQAALDLADQSARDHPQGSVLERAQVYATLAVAAAVRESAPDLRGVVSGLNELRTTV